ncbi:hypothetical protein CF645_38225, partial [Burkholderia pseudomallei]
MTATNSTPSTTGIAHARAWAIPVVLGVLFVAVNVAVRWANVHCHLGLAESAADRMRDAGQIAPRLALWTLSLIHL